MERSAARKAHLGHQACKSRRHRAGGTALWTDQSSVTHPDCVVLRENFFYAPRVQQMQGHATVRAGLTFLPMMLVLASGIVVQSPR